MIVADTPPRPSFLRPMAPTKQISRLLTSKDNVLSMPILSPEYEIQADSICHRYMKLGMAGTTILYSSGDYGVAGNGGQCCTKAKCAGGTYNNGGSGTFNPSFPGTW